MDRRSWSMLLVLGAIWGASYMFIKIGVRDMSPAMVACVRIALAAAVLIPVAAASGALRGLTDRLGVLALVGILLGVVGVAVLLGVDLGGTSSELLGGLAVVLASLGYAIGGFLVKHRLSDAQPIGVAAAVMVPSTILLAPVAILTAPGEVPGAGPIAAVAALGVLGTGVAFAIFYSLMARVGPARAFIVTYLAPAFAVVYGVTLLDESITAATIGGLALILAGSWLAAEGRLPGRRAPPGPPPRRTPPRGGGPRG